jgi:hypothetical protein
MAGDTLLRFGDRAVAPLVRLARTPSKQLYGRNGPALTLEEMLQRPEAQKSLSARSKATVRTLASELIADRTLQSWEIGNAGRLAIATGDPELRAADLRLIEPSELTARGVRPENQSRIVSQIRQAANLRRSEHFGSNPWNLWNDKRSHRIDAMTSAAEAIPLEGLAKCRERCAAQLHVKFPCCGIDACFGPNRTDSNEDTHKIKSEGESGDNGR